MCSEFGRPVNRSELSCHNRCSYTDIGRGVLAVECSMEPGQIAVMMPTGENDTFVRQQQFNPS